MGNLLGGSKVRSGLLVVAIVLAASSGPVAAQAPIGNGAFSFQIYYVNPGFYPVVQAYLRTFDQNMDYVPNINLMNIFIQVDGKNYDPAKCFDVPNRRGMYTIDTLEKRNETFKTIFVWDCSKSMAGKPFDDARTAIQKYIQIKRPGDQIAIIAIRDEQSGYQMVSSFEKDPTLLYQRIDDVKCDGQKTRLYDSIVAALELSASQAQSASSITDAEFPILTCIVALSDGHDEGSSISKDPLLTKLSSLKTPIPIYSLAYSNTAERQYFTNMEALSKATVGRYWLVDDSQNFATTLQKIHQINRNDYVVTFRATAEPDGKEHNFGILIKYLGADVPRQGKFIAMESPAVLMGGKVKEIYDGLMQTYPDLTKIVPVPPPPIPSKGEGEGEAPVKRDPDPKPPVLPAPTPLKDIMLIAAIGAAILFLIIAIVVWVRSSATANRNYPGSTGTSTKPPSNP